jgi:hypothetical protein
MDKWMTNVDSYGSFLPDEPSLEDARANDSSEWFFFTKYAALGLLLFAIGLIVLFSFF